MKVLAAALMVTLLFLALVFTACFGTVQVATMWAQTYGGSNNDRAYSLVATSDGGYAIAGFTEAVLFSQDDFWLVKIDEVGVVPEAAWVILPLLLVATVSIFSCKKRLVIRH